MERWQTVLDGGVVGGEYVGPSVRRFRVPGGWLYQIETDEESCTWSAPLFVADADGDGPSHADPR